MGLNNRLSPTAEQLRRQERELAAAILRGESGSSPEPTYDPRRHVRPAGLVGEGVASPAVLVREPEVPALNASTAQILGVNFQHGIVETSFGDFPLQDQELQQVAFVCVRALNRSLNEFVGAVSERHGVTQLLDQAAALVKEFESRGKVEHDAAKVVAPPTAQLTANPIASLIEPDEEREAAGLEDARATIPGAARRRRRPRSA